MDNIGPQPWLKEPATQAVMDALEARGGPDCARFVGGAVRNSVMAFDIGDIDIATRLQPTEVVEALKAASLKAVPTGIEHGTITAVSSGQPFEITTLRRDVSTDGRRATVAFTDDWAEDAARRDFTINALYAGRDGRLYDPTGRGVEDATRSRVRFVGDPEQRIREDYLRILRFFRFHAWYGRGDPDAEATAACGALKEGLRKLSAERVWKELYRTLEAEAGYQALRRMADLGILEIVLPEVRPPDAEVNLRDPLLSLAALMPADPAVAQDLAARLRLSNSQRDRLVAALGPSPAIPRKDDEQAMRRALFTLGRQAFDDQVALGRLPCFGPILKRLADWQIPSLPVSGKDVLALGIAAGPRVSEILKEVEAWWIDNDFPDREAVLAELKRRAA